MLTPVSAAGVALSAALAGASGAYSAAMAVGGIADANKAQDRAEVTGLAASAGLADKDAAAAAKREADEQRASMVVNLVMSALPYLPAVAKGAGKGIAAIGREFRWSGPGKVYGGPSLTAIAAQMAADLVIDLGKAGVSPIAKARTGGQLSLNQMLSRIKQINRELDWVKVTSAIARAGDEAQLHPLSVYGLEDYIRYHINGPGTGLEGFPILAAPVKANQFANHYIEGPMREWAKAGYHVEFKASFATFSAAEMRGFVEGILRSGKGNAWSARARPRADREVPQVDHVRYPRLARWENRVFPRQHHSWCAGVRHGAALPEARADLVGARAARANWNAATRAITFQILTRCDAPI